MFCNTDKWQQSQKMKTNRCKWIRLCAERQTQTVGFTGNLTNHIRSTTSLCRTQYLFHQNLTKASMKFTMILHFYLIKVQTIPLTFHRQKTKLFLHVYFEIQLCPKQYDLYCNPLHWFWTKTNITVTTYIKVGKCWLLCSLKST